MTATELKCAVLIKSARRKARLKQSELAQLAGVSRQAISMYEIGLSVPTFKTLVAILRATGYELRCQPIAAAKSTVSAASS